MPTLNAYHQHVTYLQSHESLETALNTSLAQVPNYRYAYSSTKYGGISLYKDEFYPLQQALPGLELETGVYCSLSTLFSLNLQQLQAFVPNLCSDILPKLQLPSKDTLVISLYIRTHHADFMTHVERQQKDKNTTISTEMRMNESTYMDRVATILNCTLQLEHQQHRHSLSNTVWIVISDSPSVKQYIATHYSTPTRTILTTPARGTHSRPSRSPSTRGFCRSLSRLVLDWRIGFGN